MFICCFCGKECEGWGNNPAPQTMNLTQDAVMIVIQPQLFQRGQKISSRSKINYKHSLYSIGGKKIYEKVSC